jgi:Putative MetA-pathway of phenol degradation
VAPHSLVAALWTVCLTGVALVAHGESRGSWSLTYQQIKVEEAEVNTGRVDLGRVDTQSLEVAIDYPLTDRLRVHAGIPFVRKRHKGPGQHQPANIPGREDAPFIDDGKYHSNWQDFVLGFSYLAVDRPRFQVEPFASYGVPSSDYPFFGNAAVGQNLWHVQIGSRFTYVPLFSDFYFRFDPSYTFVEKTLGQSVNHWRAHFEVGYWFSHNFTGRAFVFSKYGDGLEVPDDFPSMMSEEWYQHDRLLKHNYTNAGIGADWQINGRTRLRSSALRMVDADNVHVVDYAFSLGVTRSF